LRRFGNASGRKNASERRFDGYRYVGLHEIQPEPISETASPTGGIHKIAAEGPIETIDKIDLAFGTVRSNLWSTVATQIIADVGAVG